MAFTRNLLVIAALLVPARLSAQGDSGTKDRTAIGGYGEVHYTNATGVDTPGQVSLKRFVLYVGHAFSDRIALRSEVEVEDAKVEGGEDGGEVALEQAYLDYAVSDGLSLRAGLLLPPVGILNELHEPPTFNGVNRPDFDHDVIPSTWREIGVGAAGRVPPLPGTSYRIYVLNGLRADGFDAASGIRGGRQEGKEGSFANPSFTGRLEYGRPGLKLAGSFWYGGTANQDSLLGRGVFDAPVLLLSADVRYDLGPLAIRGVVARITLPDAGAINQRHGTAVGERIDGGYLEAAYDLLALIAPGSRSRLHLFVRHERYNTQAAVPAGVTRDDALARRITTMGLGFKPLWNVVFKADYQLRRNRAGAGENEVLALGVGYQF